MSRKAANDARRARIQRRVEAGDDPEAIQKDEASWAMPDDLIVPSSALLYSVYDFPSEAEEDGRIFKLYEKQVGVGVLSDMTNEQIATTIYAPSTGLPICMSRFLDIFGDHLEHADTAILMRNNAELVQTGLTGEKGDRVRAQIFLAERKGGWIQKKEVKTEISVDAKIEIEKRVTDVRTNVFGALDRLEANLRDSGKTIDAEGFLREAGIEKAHVPVLTKFDDGKTKDLLHVKKTAVLPPLPQKPKWDADQ